MMKTMSLIVTHPRIVIKAHNTLHLNAGNWMRKTKENSLQKETALVTDAYNELFLLPGGQGAV